MKHLIIITALLLASQSIFAQCQFPNASYENWTELEVTFPMGFDGEVSGTILQPDDITSVARGFLVLFSATFDASISDLFLADPQGIFGYSRSTDAVDGDYSIGLQGKYGFNVSDVYSVADCSEVPSEVSLSLKREGMGMDTVLVYFIFDKGLNAIPEDSASLADFPAYAFSEIIFDNNTAWEEYTIPVTVNDPSIEVDTMYHLILTSFANEDNLVLLDNIVVGENAVNVGEVQDDMDFVVYPTVVVDGQLNVSLDVDDVEQADLSIMDVNGRLLMTSPYKRVVDVSTLSPGLYYVQVHSEKYQVNRRFMIR